MALFNLLGGGISFGNDQRTDRNPMVYPQYELNLLKYPLDLNSPDKRHYMVININEQIKTSFPGTQADDKTTFQKNSASLNQTYGNTTTVQGLQTVSDIASPILDVAKAKLNELNSTVGKFVNNGLDVIDQYTGISALNKEIKSGYGIRTVQRITDSIALYMPDTLTFGYNQSYSKLQPGGSLAQLGLSVLNSASETYKNNGNKVDVQQMIRNSAPFLSSYLLRNSSDVGKILFTAGTGGKVENPMMELLYSSPDFRSFRFDFLMMPRSEREAKEVQNIIDLLRFHQAPEIVRNSGGYFLYPPSEFDISFYYNGTENINIPKISTCVLTNIDTDYAPGGFAAYEVEGENVSNEVGRTGMPVAIRLSLSFTETEYLVKGSPMLRAMKDIAKPSIEQVSTTLSGIYGANNSE